jgi:hypothetical protein
MASQRNDWLKSTAALVLAAAQLVLLLVLPIGHQRDVADSVAAHLAHIHEAGAADHVEAPSEGAGHGENCHFCRAAEVRYTTALAAGPGIRAVVATQPGPPHTRAAHRTPLSLPHGARAPPLG